jgi:serine/threonine protein kinase/tetratricopeptide (TPR) repeat protein
VPEDRPDAGDRPTFTHTPASGAGDSPQRVGPYRIVRKVGEGGMGIVYEAEQEAPVRRRVALKLIKWGMDTKEVLARFNSERQALALMNHPNIARVYDAGATAEGRPYFAMEYVQGIPITEYCDKQRLAIRDRLALFMDVCEGVQHAHQKGIIHRDIKPSNILVSSQEDAPVPKIIDFGVAKATSQRLTEATVFTEFGQVIGTPEYMSPEQAEMTNLDIDTRTDVYSLGILLYELLTGRQPFDATELRRAGLAEIQRRLREDEPVRPSSRVTGHSKDSTISATNRAADARALGRALSGDLDWITMKAMEKDRVRRYETPHALALDIGRHLHDEPVLAGPPSGMYRARKLFRRHRVPVLAAGAVVVALIAGVIGTSWALWRAVQAERRAAAEAVESRRQTAIAEAVNGFLNNDLLAAVVPSSAPGQGKDVTMRQVLDAAAERIDRASRSGGRFASEPLVEASVRVTLGHTYRELGAYAASEPHLRRALELRRGALGANHQETARVMNQLAVLHWRQGRFDLAEPLYREVYEGSRRTLGGDHPDTLAYEMNLASVYRAQGRYQDAEPLYEHCLEARLRILGAEHRETLDTMGNFANHYQETGRYDKAEALHRRALETRRRVQGAKAPGTVSEMNNLANDLALLERYDEAGQMMRETLALKQEIYGPAHPTTLNTVSSLADLKEVMGQDAEAEAWHRQALEGRIRALGPDHVRTLQSSEGLAATLVNLGRYAEAERIAAAAGTRAAETLGATHIDTISAEGTHARALAGLGRGAEAESLLRRQVTILADKKKKGEDIGEGEALSHELRVQLGMTLAALHRLPEAEAMLLESIPKLPPRSADATRAIRFLGDFYERWNRAQPDPARAARAAEWRARLTPAAR